MRGSWHTQQDPERLCFALSDLRFGLNDVLRGIGYDVVGGAAKPPAEDERPSSRPPPHVLGLATDMLALGRTLVEPHAHWLRIPIERDAEGESLVCQRPHVGLLRIGRLVQRQLNAAHAIAAFVVTIGPRLEARAREMTSTGAALEGYVLDTVGSIAVEAVADALATQIAASVAKEGWCTTNRYSPGYCSWAVEDQRALFALLGDEPGGVSLGDSALMSPIKSVSGVIGLGPDAQQRPYPCDVCTIAGCQQRLAQARL